MKHDPCLWASQRGTKGRSALNCIADALAMDALIQGIASDTFILSRFPFEDVRVSLGENKLT